MSSGPHLGRVWVRKSLSASLLLGSMFASYTGVSLWQQQRESGAAARKPDRARHVPPVNPFASANGTHLIAFVITASDCGWSKLPATMQAVGSLRAKLRSTYGGSYALVSVVGVVLDKDVQAGLRFVSTLGEGSPDGAFDQLIVGGSWLNEQVVRLVWRERMAQAASPQVLVIERPVNTDSYLSASRIGVQNDRVLVNPIGSAEIVQWIAQGMPLDYHPHRGPARDEKPR